jgi:hypothetical protein
VVQNRDRTLDLVGTRRYPGKGFSGACGDLVSYTPPGDAVTYFFLEFLTDPGVTAAFYTPVACFCRMDGKGCALDDGNGYLYPTGWKISSTRDSLDTYDATTFYLDPKPLADVPITIADGSLVQDNFMTAAAGTLDTEYATDVWPPQLLLATPHSDDRAFILGPYRKAQYEFVEPKPTLRFYFSEKVIRGSGRIVFQAFKPNGNYAKVIPDERDPEADLTIPGAPEEVATVDPYSGLFSFSELGTTAAVQPPAPLRRNRFYKVLVEPGAFVDVAGNAFAGERRRNVLLCLSGGGEARRRLLDSFCRSARDPGVLRPAGVDGAGRRLRRQLRRQPQRRRRGQRRLRVANASVSDGRRAELPRARLRRRCGRGHARRPHHRPLHGTGG